MAMYKPSAPLVDTWPPNGLRYLPPGVAGKIIVYALLRAKSPTVPAPEAVKCTLC
jgi:hypothetical protein